MKKMMYLSNVAWSWIKQRPQFLAEELSVYYNIDVYVKKEYKPNVTKENNLLSNIKLKELFRLPMERYNIISMINKNIIGKQLARACENYDIIYLTDPSFYPWINKQCKNKKLIYDCMDDNIEFPYIKNNSYKLKSYLNAEEMLIKNCDLLITSSEYLNHILRKRYPSISLSNKSIVVNNAIDGNTIQIAKCNYIPKKEQDVFNAIYIGTIDSWFDFDLVIKSLNQFPNLIYNLYGPSGIKIPSHERLIWHGPIEHKDITRIMQLADILVMPFKLTPLVLSVNPVKLYEYISSLKEVISVDYAETRKFNNYIHLYKTPDDYMKIIQQIMNNNIDTDKDISKIEKFLSENTWKKRAKYIFMSIEGEA